MTEMFSGLGISYSGMTVQKTWIDAIAHNIANVSTVRATDQPAYATRYVLAQAESGGVAGKGVSVQQIALGNEEGVVVYDPEHPLADEEGKVRHPGVDMGDQMTSLIIAQRAYEANAKVFESARDAYRRALTIGGR